MVETKDDVLFEFAVIADTHLGPQDGVSPSPWRTNQLANERVEAMVADINEKRPAFVVHLGDMIHPIPAQPDYPKAAKRFHEIIASLESPLHVIPGNHDVGDKPTSWTPAPIVSEQSLKLYKANFGIDFYSFDLHGLHFIFINNQLLNSHLPAEEVQWAWLEKDIEKYDNKRIFLFMHYPLYLNEANEHEHADNVAQPARHRLLNLIHQYKVEAVFAGHVHNFFYDRNNKTEFYVCPSATAIRHDYSELFSVEPANEFGRDDTNKLGYFWIEIRQSGHVAHYSRTHGQLSKNEISDKSVPRLHSKSVQHSRIGVDMRDAWAEALSIPISGALDEFTRKQVRNDYSIAAIWEMGVGWLRVPIEDVTSSRTHQRMRILRHSGVAFSVFMFGAPSVTIKELLLENNDCYDRLEIVLPPSLIEQSLDTLNDLRGSIDKPVYLSMLRTSANNAERTGHYAHFVDSGFHTDDAELLRNTRHLSKFVDGLVFRTRPDEYASLLTPKLYELTRLMGLGISLRVRMSGSNPATFSGSPEQTCALVSDAVTEAYTMPASFDVVFDTLIDVDRGYFPRYGLLDRRYNHTDVSRALIRRHHQLIHGSCR